ncbi:MAG: RHS repeat-associated core domain-containing protein, partial [Hellea sp.]
IAYLYNGLGHMYRKTLPSGRNISYFNDGLGRHNKVSWGSATYADTVNYHPSGQIQTLTYGNGQVFTQGLNSRRMPYTLKVSKNGTFAQDMQYNYDVNGRVQYQFNFLNTDDTRYYQYDALGRLKQANSNKWAQADYKYDALGNLRSKHFSGWFNGTSGGPRTVTNSYNSKNQVSSSNDNGTVRTIAYDTRGNVTTLGNLAFVYDASDQPTVVTGGANGNYVYDGNMKRVKSLIDGKTIYNVYDNTGRLVHVDEVTDGKETDYLHGMGQTLARIENDVFTYLHPDHLGSPQAGTKGQGNPVAQYGDVAWNEHYTPFGEALISNAANDNQGGFTGHIKDKATGLNYMQARYYDPKIGRFLSVDPVSMLQNGKPAQFNRYSYTWNDPINGFDPDGRETRLMVEAHHLDMDVVNGNMTMGERNEISQAQLAGAVAALGTKGLGSVAKQQVKSISQRIKTAVSKKLGGCFEAGTLILTKDGKRSIETISVGDIVWSTDPEKGESGWKAVVDTFVNDESSVWQLTFADNTQQSTILHRVTGGHPYWVLSKDVWSWKFVSELKAGMVVKTKSGNQLTVIDAYDTTVIKRTYNFEVQDFHTYYVGDEEILVHNTSKKKFKPKKRRRGGDRQKGDRFKDGDDAEEQFREIDRAQQLVRKGKSNQIIDDTTKSKQRADNALNDLKKRDHQRPPPKPPED